MIKVAICDDDSLFAHQLENIILNTCDNEGIKVDTLWKREFLPVRNLT